MRLDGWQTGGTLADPKGRRPPLSPGAGPSVGSGTAGLAGPVKARMTLPFPGAR